MTEKDNSITVHDETVTINEDAYTAVMGDLDELSNHLIQLDAMLKIIHGNGELSEWSQEIQDNYLWACSTMAGQAGKMVDKIDLRTLKGVAKAKQ